MMPSARIIAPVLLVTLAGVGCRTADGGEPCASQVPAIRMSVWQPRGAHATLIYNRHGDDTLTVVDIPSTGNATPMGTKPGRYDFRVIIPGLKDFVTTNLLVEADGCQPRTLEMQIFM